MTRICIIQLVALPFLLMSNKGEAQVTSRIVGTPTACADEVGEINVTYRISHSFRNTARTSLQVRIGVSSDESFYLFRSTDSSDPDAAIYRSGPDSVTAPKSRTRTIKPNKSITWVREATIEIAGGPNAPKGLPEPGNYYLLPVAEMQIIRPSLPEVKRSTDEQFIPVTILKPSGIPRSCKR